MEEEKTEDELILLDVDTKRQRNKHVRLEGYNSDSSDDDEGNGSDDDISTRKNRHSNGKKQGNSSKEKSVHFPENELNEEDVDEEEKDGIELPEFVSNEDVMSLDDVEDLDRDEEDIKATHKEMEDYFNNQEEDLSHFDRSRVKRSKGPKIEAFNMDKENKEGEFDELGNYIRRTGSASDDDNDDEDGIDSTDEGNPKVNSHDSWLIGVNNKEINKAKEAEEKRQELINNKLTNEKVIRSKFSTKELLEKLIPHLQPAETSLETLQRLNANVNKIRKALKKDKHNKVLQDELTTLKLDIELVTETVELIQSKSKKFLNTYEKEREQLIRDYENLSGKPFELKNNLKRKLEEEDGVPSSDGKNDGVDDVTGNDGNHEEEIQWEYYWETDPDEIHGPYPSSTLKSWLDAHYFDEVKAFARIFGSSDEFQETKLIDFPED